ncbi:MAG TPA: thioredoxin family protein [Xanthomonadales bacterium]|nr:thioredoxin family protein [Xanthomonadales bacterium]
MSDSSDRPLVPQSEWKVARKALLLAEKALTEALDAVAQKRRELPWVRIDKDYVFEGPDGQQSLVDLFAGKKQLVVYHFMYGPDWEAGCPSCSYVADQFNGADAHLAARDTAFVAISNTSVDKIEAYRKRMGWQFRWLSSLGTDFNSDFHVTYSQQEIDSGEVEHNFEHQKPMGNEYPGLSVFVRTADGRIAHSYSCYARGLDIIMGAYQILDLTPLGRNEGGLPFPMAWVRRHDEYGDENA